MPTRARLQKEKEKKLLKQQKDAHQLKSLFQVSITDITVFMFKILHQSYGYLPYTNVSFLLFFFKATRNH